MGSCAAMPCVFQRPASRIPRRRSRTEPADAAVAIAHLPSSSDSPPGGRRVAREELTFKGCFTQNPLVRGLTAERSLLAQPSAEVRFLALPGRS